MVKFYVPDINLSSETRYLYRKKTERYLSQLLLYGAFELSNKVTILYTYSQTKKKSTSQLKVDPIGGFTS